MANSPEKKKELALREKQRREKDKQWLASLPEEERNKILEERRAADRARRAKFKATLSAEEIAERKAKDAAYDAEKYRKQKEAFALLPEEEQQSLTLARQAKNKEKYANHGAKYNQRRRDKLANMSPEEKAEHNRAYREYYAQYLEKNFEAVKERQRKQYEEKGHLWRKAEKERFLALPTDQQTKIKEEARRYQQEYYYANRDKLLVQKKEYYDLNRDSILTNKRAYYRENHEERRGYNKAYYVANAERLNGMSRKWYEENRERMLAANHTYRQNNRDKVRSCEREAKRRKREADGHLTEQDIKDAVEASEGICPYCLRELVFGEIHIDHMQPISRGGSNSRDNIVACCKNCNLRKNAKTVKEFVFGWRRGTELC